jgi:predicted nucleic acid-binding protein
MSYWDTSCLIKLYTPEPDSQLFRDHLDTGAACVTCDITPLEFWAAVRRKESEEVLAPGEARKLQTALESDLADGLIEMTSCGPAVRIRFDEIVDVCHSRVPPIFIRTNDAMHLAAAHCAGETEIVATDKRLREAALALGHKLFPPAESLPATTPTNPPGLDFSC